MTQKGDLLYNPHTDAYEEFDGLNWIVLTQQEIEIKRRSQNGISWPSSQGLHGNPAQGPSGLSGAPGTSPAAIVQQSYQSIQLAAQQQQNALINAYMQQFGHPPVGLGQVGVIQPVFGQQPPLPAQKIPREGLRVGELTAYRAWRVSPAGWLQSMSADAIWAPGEAMTARQVDMKGDLGIHCFKLMRDALAYGGDIWGEVSIWGEVIEHEIGYRAEFARVTSLQAPITSRQSTAATDSAKRRMYVAICQAYGVPAQ